MESSKITAVSANKFTSLKVAFDKYKYGILFMTPWILGFVIFNLYPIIYSFYLSFTNYDLFSKPEFLGFQNYVQLFIADERYFKALKVTIIYVFLGVPLQLLVALALALVLNKGIPGLKYFRAIYYLPALMGGSVAISLLWRQVFGSYGIVNQLLILLGFHQPLTSISWISEPKYSLYTLIILRVWQFGSPMIIFLAGLKQIPQQLYESAEIDGANTMKKFLNITLPLLTPILFFNLIMQIISAFQAFTPAYIIGGSTGGVLDSLLFYTLYLYIIGFTFFKMGVASAMAWILMFVVGILTIILFKSSDA